MNSCLMWELTFNIKRAILSKIHLEGPILHVSLRFYSIHFCILPHQLMNLSDQYYPDAVIDMKKIGYLAWFKCIAVSVWERLVRVCCCGCPIRDAWAPMVHVFLRMSLLVENIPKKKLKLNSLARISYLEVWVSKVEEVVESQGIHSLLKILSLWKRGNHGIFGWLQLTQCFQDTSIFHYV